MRPWPVIEPDSPSLMSSFLRPLAYRYRRIYDAVTAVSSLSVGGVEKLRGLGLEALQPHLPTGAAVLDLCCGSGEAVLVANSPCVFCFFQGCFKVSFIFCKNLSKISF